MYIYVMNLMEIDKAISKCFPVQVVNDSATTKSIPDRDNNVYDEHVCMFGVREICLNLILNWTPDNFLNILSQKYIII